MHNNSRLYCHTFSAPYMPSRMCEERWCLVVIQQKTLCTVKDNALTSISPTNQNHIQQQQIMHGQVKEMPCCRFHASVLFSAFRACGCCSADSNEGGVKARCADSNRITNSEKQRLQFVNSKINYRRGSRVSLARHCVMVG